MRFTHSPKNPAMKHCISVVKLKVPSSARGILFPADMADVVTGLQTVVMSTQMLCCCMNPVRIWRYVNLGLNFGLNFHFILNSFWLQ